MPTMRGIWKPRQLGAALSFVTTFSGGGIAPYEDVEGPDGLLRYKWQGVDPLNADNRAMRSAMENRLPLIYFKGIAKGLYEPIYPVTLVGEEPGQMQFVVALDEVSVGHWEHRNVIDLETVRRYAMRMTKVRVHQPVFRSVVLQAHGRPVRTVQPRPHGVAGRCPHQARRRRRRSGGHQRHLHVQDPSRRL